MTYERYTLEEGINGRLLIYDNKSSDEDYYFLDDPKEIQDFLNHLNEQDTMKDNLLHWNINLTMKWFEKKRKEKKGGFGHYQISTNPTLNRLRCNCNGWTNYKK